MILPHAPKHGHRYTGDQNSEGNNEKNEHDVGSRSKGVRSPTTGE